MNPPQLPGSRPAVSPQVSPDTGQNPLLLLHRLLRGRYVWAILLAGLLGPTGALIGYKALPPKYESTAIIRIAPVLSKILYENEQNAMLPMFEAYVQAQVSLLTSSRLRDIAMRSEEWKAAGGAYTDEAKTEFAENLKVNSPKGNQVILVSYEDKDPRRAQAAAKSVVDAYLSLSKEEDSASQSTRFRMLEEREKGLAAEISGLQNQIMTIAHEYGSDALDTIYEYKVQELQKIETELEAAKLHLATLESAAGQPVPGGTEDLSVERIAAMDRQMQQLVSERNQLQLQIQDLAAKFTKPERRPEYQQATRQLAQKESEIEQYARTFRETGGRGPAPIVTPIEGMAPIITITDPVRARERVARIEELYNQAREATLELGRKNLQIQDLRYKLASAQEKMDQTKSRIEQLSVESSVSGRITEWSQAELPIRPSNAKKFMQFAVLGGMAGGGLGVGIVLLVGLINRKIRFIADAEEQHPRLLGAVPSLPDELTDPTEAMVAAQCVHRIRVLLQPRTHSDKARALTVTSAAPGTGKTSLTLALGLSFAASGARTLLIDGDVVGMGLSRRARDVSKKPALLTHATNGAAEGERADAPETLAKVLTVTEKNRLDDDREGSEEASGNGSGFSLGLIDALQGIPVDRCLTYIGVPNLVIMPASGTSNGGMTVLSRTTMTALVDSLRDSYEFILIDTGPVPGPTDSSVMAGSTDGVIMVASRGEQLGVVRQALQHLDLIQAPLIGMVFNRARSRDIEQAGHSSVSSSHHNGQTNGHRYYYNRGELSEDAKAFVRLGPLAQAVLFMSNLMHSGLDDGVKTTNGRPV